MQISWLAQRFVNLEAQISWQAQRFVNLEVSADFAAGAALDVLLLHLEPSHTHTVWGLLPGQFLKLVVRPVAGQLLQRRAPLRGQPTTLTKVFDQHWRERGR